MYTGMTNWKMIQSVKQEGKQSGVWKKVGKKYFFWKKKGNFILKYFFEKKNYFKTHLIHMTMHVHDSTWSGGICRHKKNKKIIKKLHQISLQVQ